MKLLRQLSTKFALLGLVFSVQIHARDLREIQKTGTIVFLTEGAFYPFSYFDDAQLTGFEIDFGEALAKRLDLKAAWQVIDFDAILPMIYEGWGDVGLASHAYTEQRAELVAFATPHYCTSTKIVSLKGGTLTRSALQGKTLGTQVTTTFFEDAKKMTHVKKNKAYRTEVEVFDALRRKEVDAILSDKWVNEAILHKDPNANIVIGDEISKNRISIIMHKENKALLDKINQTIDALKRDGTLLTLSQKYLRTDITCPE